MRGVKFESIVSAIRTEGASWCDETLLDRFEPLPQRSNKESATEGNRALAVKKLPGYLKQLADSLTAVMPESIARTMAGSLTLLRVVGELDSQLRAQFTASGVRQSTEFELTELHGALLAARMLWIESLREIVLGDSAVSGAVRAAVVEETLADIVRRYAAASRGLLLHERPSAAPLLGAELDAALQVVSGFVRSEAESFVSRTDRICDSLGIHR